MTNPSPAHVTRPNEVEGWLQPSQVTPAEPRWGFAAGVQVGLPPLRGPRGLLRLYAPYLGHTADRLINFIAIEPVVEGGTRRGYSELEHSRLDDLPGKRLWSADVPTSEPRPGDEPSAGAIAVVDGVEHLTVLVMCERFDNGAHVYVRVRFRADRPEEVALAAFRHADSAPLERCILTATMGNFARLRRLRLQDGVRTPAALWPDFTGPEFTEHARFGLDLLLTTGNGAAMVHAEPDEVDHSAAAYAEGTSDHWRYRGGRARQSWIAEDPHPQLEALVNARATYWASSSPIPGGPAYENFELTEPFRDGRELRFRIEPLPENDPE